MEVVATFLMVCSALCLMPILVKGAISDIKTRRFPKAYWDSLLVNLGGIITIIFYLYAIAEGYWFTVTLLLILSASCMLLFNYLGLAFGSGGDWRALIYISAVCPFFIVQTVLFSLLASLPMVVYETLKQSDNLEPVLFRTVPFAVAILGGLIMAILCNIAFGI